MRNSDSAGRIQVQAKSGQQPCRGGASISSLSFEDAALVRNVTAAVAVAATPDDALARIAAGLEPKFDIWRASLRTVDAARERLFFIAVWSRGATRLQRGIHMSVSASPLPEILATEMPVVYPGGRSRTTFSDALLVQEGIRSRVTMALWEEHSVFGLLGLGSRNPGAIRQSDVPFFDAFGGSVSRPILHLLRATGEAEL